MHQNSRFLHDIFYGNILLFLISSGLPSLYVCVRSHERKSASMCMCAWAQCTWVLVSGIMCLQRILLLSLYVCRQVMCVCWYCVYEATYFWLSFLSFIFQGTLFSFIIHLNISPFLTMHWRLFHFVQFIDLMCWCIWLKSIYV